MPTTNLGITYIAQNQSQKEVTANAAFDALDGAVAGVFSDSITTDITLTDAEAKQHAVLVFTGTLAGDADIIVPTGVTHVWYVLNNTAGGFDLVVKTVAGSGVTIAPTTQAIVYCDGTNVVSVASGAGGAGTPGGSDKSAQYNNAGSFGGITVNATATNKYLQQVSSGTPTFNQVSDADLSTTDITTNNVTIAKHGFAPKMPNDATKYLDGTGAYTTPTGSGATAPGGSDKGIQYNDTGSFGGIAVNATATNKFLRQVSSGTASFVQVADADLSFTDITTNNASTSAHGFAPKYPNDATLYLDGTGAYTLPPGSGGAGALSGLTAAVGANTISNLDQAQVWQWKLTTSGKIAFNLTESVASTAAGTPVLLQLNTLAASTMLPLLVKVRGTEVCRVSAATTQMTFADGSSAAPTIAFTSNPATGLYAGTNILNVSANGTNIAIFRAAQLQVLQAGSATAPNLAGSNATCGLNMGASTITFCANGEIANISAGGSTAGPAASMPGLDGAIASPTANHTFNFHMKRARGTVASPTVITTGDNIGVVAGSAYVGATGTYVTCARILYTTEGTLADTTTGIGGIMAFQTMKVGSAIAERGRMDSKGNFVWGIAAGTTTDTDGFVYIPNCPGAQTGVPTTYAGRSAMRYDTTNKKLWMYNSVTPGWDFVQFT